MEKQERLEKQIKFILELDKIKAFTDGHEIVKTIYVPKKLINIVMK